jgi:biopolymer transport protein ExbD
VARRLSKSHHTTLSELNITPLLDLAFVLLVIFILTTSPITADLPMELPKAANRPKASVPKVHFVTVDKAGSLFLDRLPVSFETLRETVIQLRNDDPDLNVVIRGDSKAPYRIVREALDTLQQCNLGKVKLATDAYMGK